MLDVHTVAGAQSKRVRIKFILFAFKCFVKDDSICIFVKVKH